MLSQVHGIYDPHGLISPLTVKYKILIQKLVDLQMGWDESLEEELREEAVQILRAMVLTGPIIFKRSALGDNWENGWSLVGFWDGGKPASACCLYARTSLAQPAENGETHEVRLLAAKARVTPSSKKHGNLRTSTPRTEMRGCLLYTSPSPRDS